jgi:hypothetical protein
VEVHPPGLACWVELRRIFEVADERCLTKAELETLQDALHLAYQIRVRSHKQQGQRQGQQ